VSLSRQVGLNAAGQMAGRLYTATLSFVVTAVLLPRQLGETDFGIFAWYLTLYQLITSVLDFGLGTIVIRDASRDRSRAGHMIGMLVLLKALIAAVSVALLVLLAFLFEGWGMRLGLLSLAALHLFFHAPGGASAIFHVDMAFRWVVTASATGQTVWLLATAALLAADESRPAPYLVAFGLGPVVTGCLGYLWAARRIDIRFDATRAELAQLWKQAWPAGVSMTLASVYFYIDTAMLRPMLGEVAVAHYSAAYRIMTFMLMVPVVVSQVFFPVYARLWHAGADVLRPFYRRTLRLLFSVGVLITVLVPQVRNQVIALVYPPEYAAGADTLGILSLAVVLVFCAYPQVQLLLAAGQQRVMMVISAFAAAFNVAANLWAIPRHGIEGAAWTTVMTEALVLGAAIFAGARHTGLRPSLVELLRPAACALLAITVYRVALPLWADAAVGVHVALGVAVGLLALLLAGVWPLGLGTEGSDDE
jgi:O-antigen/teichoic acid export membrane protein